jgi:hypothetical protein
MKGRRFLENRAGRTVLAWGVKENDGQKSVVTLSFNLWMTPEEAIEGYCKQAGKSWEQLTNEGAQLVQRSVVVFDKPDHESPASSGAA